MLPEGPHRILMPGRAEDEEVYRALYRPGADARTVARFLEHRAAAPADPAVVPEPRRRRIVAIGTAAAVIVALCIAVGGPGRPSGRAPNAASAAARATDAGPQRFASGVARRLGTGRFAYVVAAGDTALSIAHRFGVCPADVYEALPQGENDALRAGDTVLVALAPGEVGTSGGIRC